jgi:hypothetical protein
MESRPRRWHPKTGFPIFEILPNLIFPPVEFDFKPIQADQT